MKTEQELHSLASKIYWQVENGDMEEARKELKNLQVEGMLAASEIGRNIANQYDDQPVLACVLFKVPMAILEVATKHSST